MNEKNDLNQVSNKKDMVKVVLIVIITILLIASLSFIAYDKLIKKQDYNFKAYNVGDNVTLTDSSRWSVLSSSSGDSKYVTLIKDENINDDFSIKFKDANNYLSTTYKNNLVSGLGAKSDEITEVRLLTLDEISKLSGISVSNLLPGTSLENDITPSFLYQSTTITSEIDEYDCPIMICGYFYSPGYNEDGPARICEGTQTDTEPIRPVITILKEYIR